MTVAMAATSILNRTHRIGALVLVLPDEPRRVILRSTHHPPGPLSDAPLTRSSSLVPLVRPHATRNEHLQSPWPAKRLRSTSLFPKS